jgi:hypothetical protein
MAKSATQTDAAMTAEATLPLVKGGRVVQVNLVFDGLAFSPANLIQCSEGHSMEQRRCHRIGMLLPVEPTHLG